MKFNREILIISCLLLTMLASWGFPSTDTKDNDRKLEKQAALYMKQENYEAALGIYAALERRDPTSPEYKYKMGICYIQQAKDKHKAVAYLLQVKEMNPNTKDLDYYLGRAYHKNYNFELAIEHFNATLELGKPSSKVRLATERYIKYCHTGKVLLQTPLNVNIRNIGKPINSSGSEYVPAISMDQSMMIYTYKGERSLGGLRDKYGYPDSKGTYSEDIYLSYKVGDSWIPPEKNKMFYATVFNTKVQEGINTTGHDASIALSGDGQSLFVYKDTEIGSGDIYISKRSGLAWTYPTKLNTNINSDHWEGSASLSADKQTLYFSSERPGGEGGKDIYMSEKRENGIWGEAISLGPNINTSQDDDAPFIHADDKTLYFSSMGQKSMGGYDIFISRRDHNNEWGKPENIGFPINTAADDIYYVVTGDGTTGYFSSSRVGGYGQQDIYTVTLGSSGRPTPIVLLKGKITADDNYTAASVTCTYEGGARTLGPFTSNSATGEYIISLPIGHEYLLTYLVDGHSAKSSIVNSKEGKEFREVIRNINLYSPDFNPQLTIDGNVLYSEKPTRPAGDISVRITNKSGTFSQTMETNQKGAFRCIDIPANQHYTISVEAKDPNPISQSGLVLKGTVRHSGLVQKDVKLNDMVTDDKGHFRIDKGVNKEKKYTTIPAIIPSLEKLNVTDPELYQEIMQRYGTVKADLLVFRVQIAALKNPRDFDYAPFAGLGEVEQLQGNDTLTLFVIGELGTLSEAEALKDKIIQRDVGDAFTIMFLNGKHKDINDLIARDFFQK